MGKLLPCACPGRVEIESQVTVLLWEAVVGLSSAAGGKDENDEDNDDFVMFLSCFFPSTICFSL